MTKHIVHSYDQELSSLTNAIIDMGMLVMELLSIAGKSLATMGNREFVNLAQETDKKVNEYDENIESQATKILALRQPMAVDLRQAVSALKLAVILERMGDLCKNTTKRAADVTIIIDEAIIAQISHLVNLVYEMMSETLQAFKEFNDQKARSIPDMDNEIDKIYYNLLEILQKKMMDDPSSVPSITHIIFAIKNIERIGDYTTKIARMLNYIVTAEKVKKVKLIDVDE